MTSSSKQIRQKTQNTEKKFFKRIGRKCRLTKIHNEQNNDHAQIMHKIQFRSSFKTKEDLLKEFCLKGFFFLNYLIIH